MGREGGRKGPEVGREKRAASIVEERGGERKRERSEPRAW